MDVGPKATARPGAAAPWVRTRLRAAPGAACALALLVALTACLAAALPRAVDRYGDAGLRQAVTAARPDDSTVRLYAPQPDLALSQREREAALRADALDRQYAEVRAAARAFPADPGQSSYGVRTAEDQEVPDRWLPRPYGLPARVVLAAQAGLADHARLRAGRLPRTDGTVTAASPGVEAAVTAETAKHLRIKVGSVIHVPGVRRGPLAVRITGIVVPRERAGAYWSTDPVLRTPSLLRVPGPGDPLYYWLGALLLPPDAAPAMLGTAGQPWRYWQLAPSTDRLRAHDLPRLASAVADLENGPALRRVREATHPEAWTSTELDEILAGYTGLRSAIGPLVAVAALGTGTVAVVVLLMAGGLAADRRRPELALLRARGGSLPGIAGRLFAETAVVAVPAGALGLTAALLAVPGGRHPYAVAAALAVTLTACAALPLRAAAAHRSASVHGARGDLTSVRPSRRRTVAELTLLVLATGAVVALRRRGTGGEGTGAGGDELVSAAPVLVGVIAALVLVRLYPLPLRALARQAGRLRGAVAHLALARAGRTSVSAVLPLLALLTSLTTAAFGGSVLTGVSEARDRAALLAVGADARVEAFHALPANLPDRLRRTPGVRDVTPVSIAYHAAPNDGRVSTPLVGVEPRGYAELARRTGLGAFGESVLRGATGATAGRSPHGTSQGASEASGDGPAGPARSSQGTPRASRDGQAAGAVPALASPAVAARYGSRPFPVRLEDRSVVTVRIVLVRDRTPALVGQDFLLVDRAALSARAALPNALLLTGDDLDGAALREAAGDGPGVKLRDEERARYVNSPLQSGAERVYTAAVAAGAGYTVLALLLTLLRAAPERAALLARLRTMGLTRAQGRRLLVLESLPQAVLAAAGGVLTGWATIRLLSPGIDLTTIALASAPATAERAALHTDPVSLVVPALAVVVLTVGVAAGQAWWTGRRGSVRELRAGDTG
ncbi:FtsX-like permease family protein [Streptomyces sp. DH24]|uniref:FtsX-like permease family protein n=1 Tax=Streptomyces sp. DH24 TaxID=3040123 RepID=UPI0024421220|nr:FtsX-like permease family protein [Streptomyces sp. DH24]MDG9716787.1 ABC transporter permease [Streptomyces sp. DH24]